MKQLSQRRAFVVLMTLLTSLTGAAFGLYELRGEPDLLADIVKISGLLALTSLFMSFAFWTVTHLKKDSPFRGGVAGLLTGLAIVPMPYFTSNLKTEFFRIQGAENSGVLMSLWGAVPVAMKSGLATFQLISKVSLIAVICSIVLGVFIAKTIPPRSGGG